MGNITKIGYDNSRNDDSLSRGEPMWMERQLLSVLVLQRFVSHSFSG